MRRRADGSQNSLVSFLLRVPCDPSVDRSEPPHVHVRREKMVAKFWLEPVALERAGGFSRVELNAIARLVQEHRERLLESWHEFFAS